MIKKTLLMSSFICSSLLSNECQCSNIMSKKLIEVLHQRSKIVNRKVIDLDWKNSRVFLQDSFEDRELLANQEINKLKSKSFIPPSRKVVKMDPDKDIIYYEK